ncbi:MAG: HD domain-containing protein [Fibrobacterales bacterium]
MISSTKQAELMPVRISHIEFYRETALYYFDSLTQEIVLYKEPGSIISQKRISHAKTPKLFIRKEDRLTSLLEVQHSYTQLLDKSINSNDIKGVKQVLISLVTDFFSEPRNVLLDGIILAIDMVLKDLSSSLYSLTKPFEDMSYTTALHSTNVMCLALGYTLYHGGDATSDETRSIALAGLFHDIGKTLIDDTILNKPGKLSQSEFEIIKQHPQNGHTILKAIGITDTIVLQSALEHHENPQGTGYPHGTQDISEIGALIGFIDKYEALTSRDRVYKEELSIYETLNLLKGDTQRGFGNISIFNNFVHYMASCED